MEGCEDVRFKQCAVIELLSAEKFSPVNSHGLLQAVCGINVLMSAQSEVGYGNLSKKIGKQIRVRKQGRESQRLQLDGIQKLVQG
jgi:hypothetical protein